MAFVTWNYSGEKTVGYLVQSVHTELNRLVKACLAEHWISGRDWTHIICVVQGYRWLYVDMLTI